MGMPTFHLLYFRDSVLEHGDEVELRDVLEAVQAAAGRPADLRVEIWSDNRKVAAMGSSLIEPRPPRRARPT
jgi:hypothetical protein